MSSDRGYMGFSEALLATSVVCIGMLAFVAFAVPAMTDGGHPDDAVMPDTGGISIIGGVYVWDCDVPLGSAMDRSGCHGITVKAETCSQSGAGQAEWTKGVSEGACVVRNLVIDVP